VLFLEFFELHGLGSLLNSLIKLGIELVVLQSALIQLLLKTALLHRLICHIIKFRELVIFDAAFISSKKVDESRRLLLGFLYLLEDLSSHLSKLNSDGQGCALVQELIHSQNLGKQLFVGYSAVVLLKLHNGFEEKLVD